MQVATTRAVRQAGNLQNIVNQHRISLERQPKNKNGKVNWMRI
jgi:hypothetical protein